MKVYVVVSAASGEDYTTDMPYVHGVFKTKLEAVKCYHQVKEDYLPADDSVSYDDGEYANGYEITNFDDDYHAMVRIIEQELKLD